MSAIGGWRAPFRGVTRAAGAHIFREWVYRRWIYSIHRCSPERRSPRKTSPLVAQAKPTLFRAILYLHNHIGGRRGLESFWYTILPSTRVCVYRPDYLLPLHIFIGFHPHPARSFSFRISLRRTPRGYTTIPWVFISDSFDHIHLPFPYLPPSNPDHFVR